MEPSIYGEIETKEEREARLTSAIRSMRIVCSTFYQGAILTGHHPFIEFCGVMSKYIGLCEDAMKQGIDFTEADIHTGKPMQVDLHHLEYLAEKLSCIFAPMLKDEKAFSMLERVFRTKLQK